MHIQKRYFLFETKIINMSTCTHHITTHTYSFSTYSNTRNSLSKLTDDRIRSVWSNGVLIEDQTDTTNPEAEERITHHHLYCVIFRKI